VTSMAGIYKLVGSLSWWLGAISLIAGLLVKLAVPSGIQKFGTTTAHSLVFFAGVLFLCTLATRTMEGGK